MTEPDPYDALDRAGCVLMLVAVGAVVVILGWRWW